MKTVVKIMVLIFSFILLISLAACGGSPSAAGGSDIAADATAAGADAGNNTEAAAAGATEANAAAVTAAATAELAPDAKSGIDDILGNWIDINDPARFANITKTDTGYLYEDNEGKYEATFQDGLMGIKVSDTDVADVYYDAKAGNLILDFQGSVTKFKRK